MPQALRDLRLAVRGLGREPGFAAVVIFTLAVGLAANATIFALVDGLVLRPFPLRDIGRLVQVFGVRPQGGFLADRAGLSPADFLDWRRSARSADRFLGLEWWDANVTGSTEPERVQAFKVSVEFFESLGVGLPAGRGFLAEEGAWGRHRVAVVGHGLWTRRYHADRAFVGRTIQLDGEPYLVVGIAPPRFDYPVGTEVWVPLAFSPEAAMRRDSRFLQAIARLRKGATPAMLDAELDAKAAELARQFPASNRGWSANVLPLAEAVRDIGVGAFLAVWQTSAFLILLIACVNVANMMLARGTVRQKEMALRHALGASRWRLVRQLLTESLVVSIAGAALAVPLAWAALRVTTTSMPPQIARFVRGWDQIDIDARLALVMLGLAFFAAVVSGLLPALRLSSLGLVDSLKEGGRMAGGARHRLRHVMVLGEVALALTLLVAAGLSVRGAWRVLDRHDGYDPQGVLTLRITLPESRYGTGERRLQFFQEVLDGLRAQPGVERVAAVSVVPSSGNNLSRTVEVEGRPVPAAEQPSADYRVASPGYFQAMRVPLLAGRDFDERDQGNAMPVAVVSRSMAERFWPGQDPVGRRFRIARPDQPWLTVTGVAGDVRHDWFLNRVEATFYVAMAQAPDSDMALVLRTGADPAGLTTAARQAIHAVDTDQPVYEVRTMWQVRSEKATGLKYAAGFMGAFGFMGLVLAALGVYGVTSYAVSQRTQEIGVRLALGATRRQVLTATLGQALRVTGAGVGIGLLGAWVLAKVMERVLFGAVELDAASFVVFPLALSATAVLAAYLPARRAMRVDPIVALRAE